MSVFFVITYNIENQEEYLKYNPGSNHITAQTATKHGGEIISIGQNSIQIHGEKQDMKVIIKFPSKEDAKAWYEDEEYAKAKELRLSSTKDINAFIIDELIIPS